MATRTGIQDNDATGGGPLNAVRATVLRFALSVTAVALPIASVFLLISSIQLGALNTRTMVLSTIALIFPALWLVRDRVGFRTSAVLFVGSLAFVAFVLASRGGLTVAYASIQALCILSSALFFGRRGAVLSLVGAVGIHAAAWALIANELVPPFTAALWDTRSGIVWFRAGLSLAMLGAVIAATELYVVERLAREAEKHQALAEQEARQRLALERAEEERTRAQEQRELAQRGLERARRVETLAQLAGGIAHDFNNTLTVIIGTTEVARLGQVSDHTRGYLNEIAEAAKRAGTLTAQLLSLGRAKLTSFEEIDLVPYLQRLRDSLRRVLPEDVALVLDLVPSCPPAYTEVVGLERAIFNLVLNARDAMPQGGKITITCRHQMLSNRALPDGSYVVLRVTDTGLGMSETTLAQIFDPFFSTKGDKGTGLGLATVVGFAKDTGGDVEVSSSLGIGTTFSLYLPVRADAAPERSPSTPAAVTATARAARGRVLVVEDSTAVRTNMVRTLEANGFEVDAAADGAGALRHLARSGPQYRVMCIDGIMPGLATREVIARASDLAPKMGVLICSGYLREDLLRRDVQTGRFVFLPKPFTTEQLLTHIDRAAGNGA